MRTLFLRMGKIMTNDFLRTGLLRVFLICLILTIFGCGGKSYEPTAMDNTASYPKVTSPEKRAFSFQSSGSESPALFESDENESEEDSAPARITQPNNRKIIYKSQLSIHVESFDGVDATINQLVNKHNGFVANANLDHLQGKRRNGHWQIRVPVENYQSFMSTIGNIGQVVKRNEDASDVTAEFYDLEARIKNKERLEERIAGLLAQASGDLTRLIKVEHELARVREEIERMQGRKRLLMDVTSLTTIDIQVEEIEAYAPAEVAAFNDRVGNAWTTAVTQATQTGQNLIVTVVRNAINVGVILVGLIFAWLVYRIFFRKRAIAHTTT